MFAINAIMLQTDATYKITWHKFPVLIIGISDAMRRFYPLGLAVCSKERHYDFKFLFNSLQLGRQKIFEPRLSYDLSLMADGSDAITNGYREAGFVGVREMCWFHVVKNIKSYLSKVEDRYAKEIRFDIEKLQKAQTPMLFEAGAALFVSKWISKDNESVKTFIEYFKREWLINHDKWYESFNHPNNVCSCSTNNGNESINNVIKKEDTFRELLSFNQFKVVCCKIVRKWSYNINPTNINAMVFATRPSIYDSNVNDLPLWTKAYNWQKETEMHLVGDLFYAKASDNLSLVITSSVIMDYEAKCKSCQFKNFGDWVRTTLGMWRISIKSSTIDASNLNLSSCTCPVYFKRYVCKHIIGVLIRQKFLKPPVAAKNIPIGKNRLFEIFTTP